MGIEAKLDELIAALKENTAAHENLAKVAVAASNGKPAAESSSEKSNDKDTGDDEAAKEAEAKKKAAAKKAAETKRRKAAEAKKKAEAEADSDVVTEISDADLRKSARDFMSTDDADERDTRKENFRVALDHLGAGKLSDVSSGEDRARLASYIAAWEAGSEKIDFEAIDEKIAEATEAAGGDDDGMLG